jgi:hypothetical protein
MLEMTDSELQRKLRVLDGHTVTTCKRKDLALIAWAKAHRVYLNIDRRTVWGNPFLLDVDGDRDTVCDMVTN